MYGNIYFQDGVSDDEILVAIEKRSMNFNRRYPIGLCNRIAKEIRSKIELGATNFIVTGGLYELHVLIGDWNKRDLT